MRVRTAYAVGKLGRGRARPTALLGAALSLAAVGCATRTAPPLVTLQTLEDAPSAPRSCVAQVIVSQPDALRGICTPLGPRLGLIQVRNAADWARLAQAVPGLGSPPDWRTSILVGLACWAGTPVDGGWPVHIASIRVQDGAGLMEATFRAGSYLPDGVVYVETVHVRGVDAVLAVDVNGATFYPE